MLEVWILHYFAALLGLNLQNLLNMTLQEMKRQNTKSKPKKSENISRLIKIITQQQEWFIVVGTLCQLDH